MAKIDEIKEFIGFLKAIFVMMIVVNTSLIAWIFKNFQDEFSWKLYIVVGLIFFMSLSIATLFVKKKLKN